MDKKYIPVSDLRGIDEFLPDLSKLVKPYERVVVTSTIQFKHRVREVADYLEAIPSDIVLGCRVVIPDCDCVVIITTGEFHALKVALITGKPVFVLSPSGIKELDQKLINDFKKKQAIRVSKVLDAKVIGVLVSTKSGQSDERLGSEIVNTLRVKGREAYLFMANDLSPAQLNDFPVDAWVNTACPRIIEDEFDKPIVNWDELRKVI